MSLRTRVCFWMMLLSLCVWYSWTLGMALQTTKITGWGPFGTRHYAWEQQNEK